ncbi:Crp/Fnr family transcriptional regulator [Streptomyces noursei]|uniref:Crp/Fnr family transcriptional regulator n=1 Tax=Streptomyces noursei TaxID=1971 RepID=UPI001677E018|nr:Crp/Fnr family transcriptional regulator [Streptomyces noursei]MCZ1019591.1 Crp/Fnr family transcriptional regulator [Streptomyces noursei]GGX09776.1 Crp/Fnr family transcriptional regulator [Streptomyces noursei]
MSKYHVFSVRTLRDLVSNDAWAGLTRYPSWSYASDQILLRQGTQGTHVLALSSGLVKVVRSDRDGRQRLLAFRGPGEILGEMALQGEGVRLADVRTMSKCKASVIPAEDFRRFVREHQLAYPLAVLASSRLREQTEVYDGAVHERLAVALIRLVEVSGVCSFPLTREELAQHIGVGRNSVSKALKHLGSDRVEASKSRITVTSVESLKRMLASPTST